MHQTLNTICHVSTCKRPGCSVEAGCQGHVGRERKAYAYAERASALVYDMARDGLVLTVEQLPLMPFAMGHHITKVHVREARKKAG